MLDGITIKINNVEYTVKKSYRSLLLFEETTGRGVDKIRENVSDLMTLFWCMLKSNNRETFKFSFDEFIDLLDEYPETIEVFNDYLMEEAKKVEKTAGKKKVKSQ